MADWYHNWQHYQKQLHNRFSAKDNNNNNPSSFDTDQVLRTPETVTKIALLSPMNLIMVSKADLSQESCN